MKLKIAVLAGDGIGPEVTNESIKVLNCIAKKFNHKVEMNEGLVGAIAIDNFGDPYPVETHDLCLKSDAVLFGAIGDPKYDNDPKAKIRPEQGLLEMRRKLGLFANLRPTVVFDSLLNMSPIKEERITGTDILFVRELTGGIYFGERGRKNNDNYAFDTCQYSRDEIIRIAKMGFEYAQKRSKKLCCVDKANILETSRLWRETVQSMEKDYPEVTVTYEFVDAVAMRLIQWPSSYDVLITSNLFGDILTDEASVISGSMGLMPSASVGSKNAVYEPIHGSYPEATGKKIANPIASILSLSMMLDFTYNLKDESSLINNAVESSLLNGFKTSDLVNKDEKAYSTNEVGDYIVKFIQNN
ncbi:MAG: 3-isopropylmalate dehydrogenase [Flavobacteriales bacterium]|nr:MAG: 3-isopropylmalate dehydrogenase [Flavobacteriales bacterium]